MTSSRFGSSPSADAASWPAPLRRRSRRRAGRLGSDAVRGRDAAEAGGTLFYYNWAQYVNPKTYAAFEKATGIKVKKAFYDSNETLQAKLQGGARGYDLVVPDGLHDEAAHRREACSSRSTGRSCRTSRRMSTRSSTTRRTTRRARTRSSKDWGTTGFMYRTDKIKERPTSWKEFVALTKKYWKTSMVDSSPEVIGSIATMLGYSYSTDDQKELDEVKKVLLDLKPHIVAIHSSNYDTLIARGKAWMGLGWSGDGLLLASKVPAQYVVAKEGGEIWIDYYNIPVGANNPDAAHAWIDFVYQPKNNGVETSYTYYGSPLKRSLLKGTAAGKLLTDPVVFPAPATVAKLEINQVTPKGTRLRERIWTEFKAS